MGGAGWIYAGNWVSFANPVWYEIEEEEGEKPSLEIRKADDTRTGISFYGVPGGHEINSFLFGSL